MENLAIFCADVGSIKKKNFGWAAELPGSEELSGTEIDVFAQKVAEQIREKRKVALGFECPLFVPIRTHAKEVNGARAGEENRSWSAGAGTAAMATGLVEVLWVMNKVSDILQQRPKVVFSWCDFLKTDSIFLWEAFITASEKGIDNQDDAKIAVSEFKNSLPNPWDANAIKEESVLSLVGAAALRSGWSEDLSVLSTPCVVIKAQKNGGSPRSQRRAQ